MGRPTRTADPAGAAAFRAPIATLAEESQIELFALPPRLPHGLVYRAHFISRAEEAALLAAIAPLPFRQARFQQYVARRRVVHFHADGDVDTDESYDDGESFSLGPVPPFMAALQHRVAEAFGMTRLSFVHTLVTEYPPGAPIGWHRDKPTYGVVFGISLKGRGMMRFRPLDARVEPRQTYALELEPRSLYMMQGPIRWLWQHSMLPARELRYSITFRTRAQDEAASAA
ncbi:MAG TPA: alpha-ketoglutarate-dependent dioxygenase AlkB [Casimicrobiaceae bacterium]|jgi:alkylated DNA repair dioxygenase AlkB